MLSENRAVYEEQIQINTYECDPNQTWKPAAFFQHLTEAANHHASRLGLGFVDLYTRGLFWVHSRMKLKFLRFPHVSELITIRTWPKIIQQKLFYIRDFEVTDANKQQIAVATSAWLIINAKTRAMTTPQSLNLDMPKQSDQFALDEPMEKINLAQNGEESLRVRATYSAVDMVGHVNNSRYIEWICDSFPMEWFTQHQLDWIQINYDHEVLPNNEVSLLVNPTEQDANLWAVEGHNLSNDTRAFEAAVRWQE
ncbi:MAG: acyl-ACP thioesterase domain-containing protein [Anaerolineaceae bacterium]